MHYEINVSKLTLDAMRPNASPSYKHLFATAPRSCPDKWECRKVYDELKARFPEPEFQIKIIFYENSGVYVDPVEL